MGEIMNAETYKRLIRENIEWLLKQPRTLERDHIELILNCQIRDAESIIYKGSLERAKQRIQSDESQT